MIGDRTDIVVVREEDEAAAIVLRRERHRDGDCDWRRMYCTTSGASLRFAILTLLSSSNHAQMWNHESSS
jgi:hypothetical protein